MINLVSVAVIIEARREEKDSVVGTQEQSTLFTRPGAIVSN